MHTNWLKRLLIGLGCALVLGSSTAVMTQAQSSDSQIPGDDCQSCHEPIYDQWENSTHSQASILNNFVAAWKEQGSPSECLACHTTGYDAETGQYEAEGLTCQVCHPSAPDEHPQKLMYTDTSSRLCGQCHVDTFNQMEDSVHNQEGMACIRCHNPHDNQLRAGGVQDTCSSCHRTESHFYTLTGHAMEGLQCTDCHLQLADGTMGQGHGQREHTFTVGEQTCTECHAHEMHYPVQNQETPTTVNPTILQAGVLPAVGDTDSHNLNAQPQTTANATMNFIILAAVTGMLFGLVGSPWIEKWFRRAQEEEQA